jgi:hypothetical protein
LLEAKMGNNNKLVVVAFFSSIGVVAKKAIAAIVTFFKCFASKKAMAC